MLASLLNRKEKLRNQREKTTNPPSTIRLVEKNILDSEPEDEGSFYGDDSDDTLSTSTTYTHTHLDFDGDKEPDIGDFVLAKLVAENSANSYHYVAGVIDNDDPEFVVIFLSVNEMAWEIRQTSH